MMEFIVILLWLSVLFFAVGYCIGVAVFAVESLLVSLVRRR